MANQSVVAQVSVRADALTELTPAAFAAHHPVAADDCQITARNN
jgi:hypothetical protein